MFNIMHVYSCIRERFHRGVGGCSSFMYERPNTSLLETFSDFFNTCKQHYIEHLPVHYIRYLSVHHI